MEVKLTLPDNTETTELRELLEETWLVPRKVRHLLRTRKNVAVNGEVTPFHLEVKAGDTITLTFEDSDYGQPELEMGNADLVTVLFEDEHMLIVNKPYGMKTHPNQPSENETLLNHVAAYLAPQNLSPYVVHRLDKETSGAILIAKSPFVLPILGRMLEAREIKRTYQGIASGSMKQTYLTINKKIGRDRHDKRKRLVSDHQGQTAITHVTVEETSNTQSFVSCVLETGRTHQIRVHLQSIGHPLVGDPLYNPRPQEADRLMLHARSLSLVHPFTKELIDVKAEPGLW